MARTTKVSKSTAAKPAEKPASKPVKKSAAKSASKPAAKAVSKPATKPAVRKAPARKPPAKKPVNKPAPTAAAKAATDSKAAARSTKAKAKPPAKKPAAQKPAKVEATAAVVKETTAKPVAETPKKPAKSDAPTPDKPKAKPDTAKPTSGDEPARAALVPLPTNPDPAPAKSSVMPMVLGGAAAAAIGFGAAMFIPPKLANNTAAFEQRLSQQDATLKALKDDVAGLSNPDQNGLAATTAQNTAAITDIAGRLEAIDNQIGALGARLTELENRLAPAPAQTPDAATNADITALRAALAEQKTQLEAMASRTAEQDKIANAGARATLRRAALTRMQTALDSGAGFAPALADLEETGVTIPAALKAVAAGGVVSLAQLQESFPDAARAALSAARKAQPETGTGGFTAFLRDQLGARSLEPQAGNDPDAILSRIEAATRENRLADALAEMETLPEVARVELSDWAGDVARRLEALAAAEQLGGN